MQPHFLAALFPDLGQPLVYSSYLNGVCYATQWTVYQGPVSDALGLAGGARLHELNFFLELDLSAVGQGASTLQQRSTLLCDDELRPVRYHSEAAGVRVTLHFSDTEVQVDLPDGSRQTVPRGGAEFVIEANMTGQQALQLAVAHVRGLLHQEARFVAFVVNSLLPTPYQTTPAPELAAAAAPNQQTAQQTAPGFWLRSSHQEELLLDARGVLQRSVSPQQGLESKLTVPPPPLPAWREEAAPGTQAARYTPPAGLRSQEVEIPGPVTPLGATLTLPPGEGPFPALLFLAGSGTHDRHGLAGEIDLGTHEILDQLTEAGYLSLRYDTRGAGRTRLGGDLLEQGLLTLLNDARASLDYLRSRPEVDRRRVFLIGHSQGGTLALALATESPEDIAGVVLLAAIGRGIDQVLHDQIVHQGQVQGLTSEQIAAQTKDLSDLIRLVESGEDFKPEQIPDHLYVAARSRRWLLEHLRHPTTELVKKLRCPLLIGQGGADFQVSPTEDAARLVAAGSAARLDLTYVLLPGLDHLFKDTGGQPSTLAQYFEPNRHVDPKLLAVLKSWLAPRTATH